MTVLVGTSGYSYPPWRGTFYPPKLPATEMLAFYATRLSTVEINNTFYRMPAADMLQRWAQETPTGFSFVLKSPQRITHQKRLADCDKDLAFFFATAQVLGDKLGPALFQLPPFIRKDLPRLEAFLLALGANAPGLLAAIEFRHASWFDDSVYELLRAHSAALCIAEADELVTPLVATAPWGYLRLRKESYGPSDLDTWASHILRQGWSKSYVFFKHEDAGVGPRLAADLIARLPGALAPP